MIEWGSVLCDLFSACCSIAEGVVSMCSNLIRSKVMFCNKCFWTTEGQRIYSRKSSPHLNDRLPDSLRIRFEDILQ